ncbi:MAG: NAD(P)H-binding protein, partial [Cyanobacteria bacterium P01_F01_bin.42]
KNLVDAAQQSAIEQFVMVSSLCISKFFHPLNLFWLVLFWKQQGEKYLQNSGLPYTIVRPGGLKSEDQDLPIVMKGADQLFEGSIPRSQVAAVCIEALKTPSAQNKILEIVCSPDRSSQSIAELIAQVSPA